MIMELKAGDIVEFKKYEDMGFEEKAMVPEDGFPKYGKVRTTIDDNENALFLSIEGSEYGFSAKSVARVISDVDINSLKPGDEVVVKATVKKVFDGFIQIAPSIGRTDVIDILKRKEPEHFIVKEGHYGMYVNGSGILIADKRHAKIYNSRNEANDEAADMHLNAWDVIPYDA